MAIMGKDKSGEIRPLVRSKKGYGGRGERKESFAERGDKPDSYVVIVNYIAPDGTRRQQRKNARTMTEANSLNRKLGTAAEDGTIQKASKDTLAGYLDFWLDNHKVAGSTLLRYRELLGHAKREIGPTAKLAKVTPQQIQAVYKTLRTTYRAQPRNEPLSEQTILHVHRCLHAAFEDAVETYDLIPKNPVRKKLAPKPDKYEATPPTLDEARKLIAAAREKGTGAIVTLAATRGARQGEMLSLKWSDLDLEGGVIRIRPATSKVKKAKRPVVLTTATVELLRQHRARQSEERLRLGKAWRDNDLVFPDGFGNRQDGSNFRRAWRQVCKAAGVNKRFHDWRHFFSTVLREQGESLDTSRDALGHTTAGMTEHYTHASTPVSLMPQTVAALDAVIGA